MIIPPDTEKDPRLFSESRTSLVTDTDLISLDEPTLPQVAFHRDYLYTGPFTDDYAAYPAEALPPYDGQRASTPRARRSTRNSELLVRITSASSSSSLGGSSISSRATARATAHGSAVPIISQTISPGTTAVGSQRSKIWEGLDKSSSSKRRRICTPPLAVRAFWHKHHRWLVFALALVVAALLIAIGLAVGLGMSLRHKPSGSKQRPWKDKEWPGGPNASVQIGTLNITYNPARDDPKTADGRPCLCNNWTPLNMSSSLSQLALTSGYFDHYISSYEFPLTNNSLDLLSLDSPLYFIAHGLAASGTVEFIGTDSPTGIKDGGKENAVVVDVLARSPKDRPLDTLAKICKLSRPDGSEGVGIYTPIETDQGGPGSTSPYLLDPLQTPAFHVIVRMPPSALLGNPNTTVFLSNVSLQLAGMGVRMGQLQNVARFGSLSLMADCRGGGIVVNYVAADNILISGAEGTVQGTFNVSSSLNINSTSGAIFGNVILHNPEAPNDISTTIQSTIPMPKTKRGFMTSNNNPSLIDDDGSNDNVTSTDTGSGYGNDTSDGQSSGNSTVALSADGNNGTSSNSTSGNGWSKMSPAQRAAAYAKAMYSKVPVRNHTVTNNFVTNEGFIFIAYLHHPPTVALQSFVASQSGMVDVSLHPNYVGPFALVNLWGSIRMPPVVAFPTSGDPSPWLKRERKVMQGKIDVSNSTFFGEKNKFSQTSESAASSVTGAAMWSSLLYPVANAAACQSSKEGNGSALYALANLGDLQVTFDGT